MDIDAPDRRAEWDGTRRLRPALAALALLLAGGCGSGGDELPVLWQAPDFALTDQTGDTLSTSGLEGEAWVVHPFFINCRDVCPATTSRMASLRDSLAGDGLLGDGVRLVSITVDPARDSTPALRRWADRHGGSPPERWAFLRGEPADEVRSLVQDGFHLSAMMPGEMEGAAAAENAGGDTSGAGPDRASGDAPDEGVDGGYQVIHASQVLVVDTRGRVRGTYEILRPAAFARLLADARRLGRQGG
jgi:cytochrome oxidase Cu insertion factor (SCO1/SenC/PrrC family)